MYIEIISVIATVIGSMMSVSWFVQAYKIWKNKSSKDVSLIFLSIFSIGNLCWFLYGLALNQLPVIVSFAIGLVGVVVVLVLALKYKEGKKK